MKASETTRSNGELGRRGLCATALVVLAAAIAGCTSGGPGASAEEVAPDRDERASTGQDAGSLGGTKEKELAPTSAVLYIMGLSTDPYRNSSPRGFGVAEGLAYGDVHKTEIREPKLGAFGSAWLDAERIAVWPWPPPFRPLIFRFGDAQLERIGASPLPEVDAQQEWSPDARLIASEPVAPCEQDQPTLWECTRASGQVLVQHADGSGRRAVWNGHFDSWTPNGRLLVTDRIRQDFYRALDVVSGETTLPISPARVAARAGVRSVGLGPPRWSADERYIAANAGIRWPQGRKRLSTIVIARANGRVIRFITSPYNISMFAWSPKAHRLAYTTSGFPDPHEIFVLDEPRAKPRKIFARTRHFDWITWSPNARWLLLDDERTRRWRLLHASRQRKPRVLPRLGGRPLWCCPVNGFCASVTAC